MQYMRECIYVLYVGIIYIIYVFGTDLLEWNEIQDRGSPQCVPEQHNIIIIIVILKVVEKRLFMYMYNIITRACIPSCFNNIVLEISAMHTRVSLRRTGSLHVGVYIYILYAYTLCTIWLFWIIRVRVIIVVIMIIIT